VYQFLGEELPQIYSPNSNTVKCMGTNPFGTKVAMNLDHVDLVFLFCSGFWKLGDRVGHKEREGIIICERIPHSFNIEACNSMQSKDYF
jgi:hypothetical protein